MSSTKSNVGSIMLYVAVGVIYTILIRAFIVDIGLIKTIECAAVILALAGYVGFALYLLRQ